MPIIFDMDGVIVDSEIHWKKTDSTFLQRLIPHWDDVLQQSVIGMSLYDVHAYLSSQHGLTLTREAFAARYHDLSEQIYGVHCALLPGVRELLEQLHAERFRVALASSSPHAWIDIVLTRFELKPLFEAALSSDDVGARGKPHPDIYLAAAKRLAVSPASCVAIEDSKKGVASALSAGMRCIGLRNGFNEHQDLSSATLVVDGFFDA